MTDDVLRARRARATIEVLSEWAPDGDFRNVGEVWEEVVRRVPLTPHEQVNGSKGRPRGETDWRWASTDLTIAGFMRKHPGGNGQWAVTPTGVQALADLPGDELFNEAQRRYAASRRVDGETLASQWLPSDTAQKRVLAAAELMTDRGLRNGDSAFAPGRQVWNRENVSHLAERWLTSEKVADKGFIGSLAIHLADASDDEILLMAEIVTWQILPISSGLGHAKKIQRVETILALMKNRVSIPAVFDEAFGGGSFGPGPAMMSNVSQAITLILAVLAAWTELGEEEQINALEEPHAWRRLVMSAPGGSFPTQRNALLYLVHPDYFGPIVSAEHRQQIRDTFLGEVSAPSDDRDEDLFQIAIAMQLKYNKPIDFYRSPLWDRWPREMAHDHREPAPPEDSHPGTRPTWIRARRGRHRPALRFTAVGRAMAKIRRLCAVPSRSSHFVWSTRHGQDIRGQSNRTRDRRRWQFGQTDPVSPVIHLRRLLRRLPPEDRRCRTIEFRADPWPSPRDCRRRAT